MRTDTGKKPIVTQNIEYTDFPEGKWEFYVKDGVLMQKNEY
jgi:hypothetical protein